MSAGTCRPRCGFEAQHALRDASNKSQPSGWFFVGAMAWVAPTQSCLLQRYRHHVRAAACRSQRWKDKKTPSQGAGRSHQESGDGGFLYWNTGRRIRQLRACSLFAASGPANRLCPEQRVG
jgi:hypothetical protein